MIFSFEVGIDRIDLSGLGLTYIGARQFRDNSAAQVRYHENNQQVQFDIDGNGTTDLQIDIRGVTFFNAGDLIL